MSFDLMMCLLPETNTVLSPQHKKLNQLIEKIEQQKLDLVLWQTAKNEIQSYIQLKLVPIYRDLHTILYHQLEQLWLHLQQEDFAQADLAQMDAKLTKLAKQLKKSNYLNTAELEKVAEVDAFYQQHLSHNQKKNKQKQHNMKILNPSFKPKLSQLKMKFIKNGTTNNINVRKKNISVNA